MKPIKAKEWVDLSKDYTGGVEWENGDVFWYKNGKPHRKDGPAHIKLDGHKSWHLDGKYVWHSNRTPLDLTNKIILSKSQHPEYPTVQIWKILGPNGLREQIIIPGMEEFIEK